MQKRKGISLIVLVITIIVMVILAGAIILTLNNSGIISKSSEAVFKQNVKSYQSELSLYLADKLAEDAKFDVTTVKASNLTTPSIKDIIKSMRGSDVSKFEITTGLLKYVGTNKEEAKWSEDLGLKTSATPLTEEEYNALYEKEIALALQYGTVTNGTYMLKDEYSEAIGGTEKIPENVNILAIPYGITSIGSSCFYGQYYIKEVILPDTITTIGSNAFADNGITTIKLPEGLTTMGEMTFCNSSLEKIIIPSNVKKIPHLALAGTPLKTVVIKEGVEEISTECFGSHSLESLYIESENCSIASNAFRDSTTNEFTVYVRNENVKSAIESALEDSYTAYGKTYNVTIICNTEWTSPE